MRDSRIKEPSVIYVITHPFYYCMIYMAHDLDQYVTYFCLPIVSSKQ